MKLHPLLLVLGLGVFHSLAIHAHAGNDYFGGQTVTFPFSPIPSGCQKIRANLMQETSSFLAKSEEFLLETCGPEIKVTLPTVRSRTRFIVEIESLTDGGWQPFGTVNVSAYPQDLLQPVRAWAEENKLEVEDPDGKLELFLEKQDIPFQSIFRSTLESPKAVLRANQGEIHFKEQTETLPTIRVEDKKVLIEMPFIDSLANNPVFQYELLKMFEQIL